MKEHDLNKMGYRAHHYVIETHEEAAVRAMKERSKKMLGGVCKHCGDKREYPLSSWHSKGGTGGGRKNVFSVNGNKQWERQITAEQKRKYI